MIPLAQPLDTIEFDELFEIARGKLPMLAVALAPPARADANDARASSASS